MKGARGRVRIERIGDKCYVMWNNDRASVRTLGTEKPFDEIFEELRMDR